MDKYDWPYVAPGPPEIGDSAANGIIYGTLIAVLLITVAFAAYTREAKSSYDKDSYMAARNSQGVVSLTLSYFVSGVGAWVIFAVPQAAVMGGSIALVGYAFSAVFPLLIFGKIAPKMRELLPQGFTINEYVHGRYGPYCAAYFGLVSLFYMMLYLTAELASAGTLATSLTKIKVQSDTWWKNDNVFLPMPISPIVGTSLITLAYTTFGGLPVSIMTDRVQGVGIFILTLIVTLASYGKAGVGSDDAFEAVSGKGVHYFYNPTSYGNSIAVAISLIMGVTCANMVHAGYWQRIWAAESNAAVVRATQLSSVLTLIVMILVGVTGFIAYSQFSILMQPKGSDSPVIGDLSFLSVPWLVVQFMGTGWAVIALIFGISMIASTCDTLQAGMSALLMPVASFLLPSFSERGRLVTVISAMVLLNVPPMLLALSGQSILQLFLLADLLAAGVVAPLFLGFWNRTHPIGALLGAIGGLVTTLVVYAVGDEYGEGYDELLGQGGIFLRAATYAFCITPAVSGLITIGVSLLFRGYSFEGYKNAATKQVEVTSTSQA